MAVLEGARLSRLPIVEGSALVALGALLRDALLGEHAHEGRVGALGGPQLGLALASVAGLSALDGGARLQAEDLPMMRAKDAAFMRSPPSAQEGAAVEERPPPPSCYKMKGEGGDKYSSS